MKYRLVSIFFYPRIAVRRRTLSKRKSGRSFFSGRRGRPTPKSPMRSIGRRSTSTYGRDADRVFGQGWPAARVRQVPAVCRCWQRCESLNTIDNTIDDSGGYVDMIMAPDGPSWFPLTLEELHRKKFESAPIPRRAEPMIGTARNRTPSRGPFPRGCRRE